MAFSPTYLTTPRLTAWVDTRGWGGETAVSTTLWQNGVWASWQEALRSGYALTAVPPWGSGENWTRSPRGLRAPSAGAVTVPTGQPDQGLYKYGSYMYDGQIFCPSRSLRDDPIPIDAAEGGVTVTLGGISYRTTHSQRRQWVIDLLLDGPLDTPTYGGGESNIDARTIWPAFLARADLGVTIYLNGAEWSTPGPLTSLQQYPGCNNRICGALVDATNLRWTPPKTGILSRYEVTITIAEVEPPGLIS